ncbi:DUF3352 domain-containing protein [Phormidesmis priestleyi ULC007]|uniref:DUF3352 domain-containing protein n=1 Tax=Phormidesmis priestleyi ULC007 TaxID=1920490 RepID=A0A2T1DG05_9CYAN|nr:DUF3352 domain-containing protein [Phormidesmis priestleyi]PSB19440.1 DUF3352 domain-containing protein [Phormidesmis priestleyi ULC007]PZO53119.1 MAG: DUF3352 domain-containing protein [Phormidesmis priestleyi]
MKLRSFFYLLATIVAGLLLTGTIAFFWLFAQSPLGLFNGSREQPSAAMFVSKQAPVMASLMVNPDRLTSLRQIIVKPSDRRQARAELDQFKQGIVGALGFDYRHDLQPWLGDEITVAVTTLDIDRDLENGQQPGYLMAMSTQNSQRSREFLQVFWQKRAIAGADLIFESYKGTKLIYGSDLKDPQDRSKSSSQSTQNAASPISFASAVVGNQFVLFANSPKVLRDAINTVQATELGLASSETYQTAIAHLNQGRIGLVFVNFPQLAALTGKESALAELATKPEDNSATYESLAIALGLDRQGLTAETALLTPTGEIASTPSTSKPVEALKYIPATSPISASGVNLDQLWSSLSQGVSGYRNVADLINRPITALNDRWKLDLPQDIFSWVKGEYALGLVPQQDENLAKNETALPGLGDWVFVADKSAEEAQQAIERLDELAKEQGISVGSLQVSDQTVNVWTRLSTTNDVKKRNQKVLNVQAEVAGVHTSVGNYEIFTTSVEAMSEVLKATQNPILKSKTFKQAIAPLATPNNGYLYLDWKSAQPLLESRFPILKVLKLAGQPFFDHLRSFTFSSYGSQPGVQQGGAFIKL